MAELKHLAPDVEQGQSDAFDCPELAMVASEVGKVKKRMLQCHACVKPLISNIGTLSMELIKDVANELVRELQATPDLVVGNYIDRNLVASLMTHKLGAHKL